MESFSSRSRSLGATAQRYEPPAPWRGVDQASLTEVRSFTLRTETGDTLTFRVGELDLSQGGFPANHLRDHMATVSPVVVEYVDDGGERVAVKLTDAQ